MKIKVHLFARAKDLAGQPEVEIDVPVGARVVDLKKALGSRIPALSSLLERCAVAVNNEFAGEDASLSPSAEVALLPPVSGG
ncbi:MAG: molybdopterin converting factor subunit 1 [Gemmataceae bacterium]|nr:molybdopterin converting factor subunit 1 [Gemmataceae bacterium]MCI0741090.1 molybdopterin converting factor subunit 1 [Gemmataceae bacterium]